VESGDWLVIFTDGVIEAVNGKDEEYGESELIRLLDREASRLQQNCCANYWRNWIGTWKHSAAR